jgi:hypothetical protein
MSVLPQAAPTADLTSPQAQAAGEVTSQGEATSSQDKVSAKIYAELARKEKALRAKEQAWKAQLAEKEQGWQQREQEYKSKYIPKDRLLTDTMGALQEAGLSYDQIVQTMMNPPSQESIINMQLQQKIKELEDKLESRFSNYEESQKQAQSKQYEAALNSIRSEVKTMVASDPGTWEMINANGDDGHDAVVAYIEDTFKETGRTISVQEAAQAIEDYLLDESVKLMQLNKIKTKLAPVPETPQAPGKPQAHKTLTHSNAPTSTRPMSARERAIAAFKGEKF